MARKKLSASPPDKERYILSEFLGYEDTLAYPAMIEEYSLKGISKVWATELCKKLSRNGILSFRYLKAPKHAPTKFYYLRRDLEAFKKLVDFFLKNRPGMSQPFIESPYVQRQIDVELVKETMRLRGITVEKWTNEEGWEETCLKWLALLKISYSSLKEFMFGEWHLFMVKPKNGRINLDYVLFRFILLTIGDLMKLQRRLPKNDLVESVFVRGGNPKQKSEKEYLLGLKLKDGRFIHYDGGFDTTHWIDDKGFPYEERENPENCWLNIWIDDSRKKTETFELPSSAEWRLDKPKVPKFRETFQRVVIDMATGEKEEIKRDYLLGPADERLKR